MNKGQLTCTIGINLKQREVAKGAELSIYHHHSAVTSEGRLFTEYRQVIKFEAENQVKQIN